MPLPKLLPAVLPQTLLGVDWVTTATITNGGASLLAATLISASANAAISYVALGTGAATLTSGVTSGVATTTLSVTALPAALAAGAHLTIIFDTNTDATVVVGATGAAPGATSIPIQSWTPTYSYPSGAGVVTTPAATDVQLQQETARVAVSSAVVGAQTGETLVAGYFDPSTASATYLEVGYFGGATATTAANTGTLVARDILWWSHTLNVDSYLAQLDSTV